MHFNMHFVFYFKCCFVAFVVFSVSHILQHFACFRTLHVPKLGHFCWQTGQFVTKLDHFFSIWWHRNAFHTVISDFLCSVISLQFCGDVLHSVSVSWSKSVAARELK